MTERPILFSAPMVRAILAGTKTQTRRVCKNQPYPNGFRFDGRDFLCHNDYLPPSAMLMDCRRGGISYTTSDHEGWTDECPFGQPGDRLWVRETWNTFDGWAGYFYAADDHTWGIGDSDDPDHVPEHAIRWRPSIHMPRAASRITLEITGVRVERLQAISDEDAKAEGAEPRQPATASGIYIPGQYRLGFRAIWESINGPASWDANPWVWVVEFNRVAP